MCISFVLFVCLSTPMLCFFFFQAEDGIRDVAVTGVQTCALPIYIGKGSVSFSRAPMLSPLASPCCGRWPACRHSKEDVASARCELRPAPQRSLAFKIGRASCRERV